MSSRLVIQKNCSIQLYSKMSKSKMKDSKKQKFKLEVEAFDQNMKDSKESNENNHATLKTLRSAKNIHQLKKLNFDTQNLEIVSAERNFRRLRQLEQQRQQLRQVWEILRESAVSAIAEKAEEIQHLKAKEPITSDQKLELYQNELHRSQQVKKQLQQEKQQLLIQFHEERSKYVNLLSEKQLQIENLYRQINQIRRQLDYLEQNDFSKNMKILELQEENQKLNAELEEKSMSLSLTFRQANQSDKFIMAKQQKTIESPQLCGSICLSISNSMDSLRLNQEAKTIITEKVEQINRLHQEELDEIRNYYENRIASIRESYQRQFRLPTQENQKDYPYIRTRRVSSSSSISKTQNPYYLNLKQVEAIGEEDEDYAQMRKSTMNDLRHEIELRYLTDRSSVEQTQRHRFNPDGDTSSQFTTRYFQNPFQFLKKNDSSRSIQHIQDQEVKTTLKFRQNNRQIYQNKVTENNDSILESQRDSLQILQKNKGAFTIGLLSGIALASFAKFLFKKS